MIKLKANIGERCGQVNGALCRHRIRITHYTDTAAFDDERDSTISENNNNNNNRNTIFLLALWPWIECWSCFRPAHHYSICVRGASQQIAKVFRVDFIYLSTEQIFGRAHRFTYFPPKIRSSARVVSHDTNWQTRTKTTTMALATRIFAKCKRRSGNGDGVSDTHRNK